MKLRLRLVAAVLALAAAGSASAQVSLPVSATGSDLIFFAIDSDSKTSFVESLGQTYTSFLPNGAAAGSSFSDNVTANANWASFISSEVAGDAITWGVLATAKGPAGIGLMSTLNVNSSTATTTKSQISTAAGGSLSVLFGALKPANPAGLSSGYFSSSAGIDNMYQSAHSNANGALKFNYDNAIGQASVFNSFVGATSIALSPATQYGNANGAATFNFDGTTLTYNVPSVVAAVPEPSTYMMLLAGLLMVAGVVARRRNSK